MADYIKIENYSKNGELAISRRIIEKIVKEAVSDIVGIELKNSKVKNKFFAYLFKPVKIIFKSNGEVAVDISITIKKGVNANDMCVKIQEEVSNALMAYAESVPFAINIRVAEVK